MHTVTTIIDLAESLGLRVEWDGGVSTADYGDGLIRVNPRLTECASVIAIAHELGHYHHGHRGNSPRQEREADEYAANLLITRRAYNYAGHWAQSRAELARELGVTMALLDLWEAHNLRPFFV